MNTRNIFLSLLTLGLAAPALTAQELHKEITVEQEIVPAKRDASRIGVLPTVSLPPLGQASLSFSDKVVTAPVPNTITTLAPVAWGDRLDGAGYRGYVDLAVGGPLWDGALSAGYRIIDNDRTRLSVWGQYDGDVYKRDSHTWKDHTASIGVDLHRATGSGSMLDAGVDYTYGYHNFIGAGEMNSQSTGRLNAAATFHSRIEGLGYAAGLRYRYFGFGRLHNDVFWLYDYDTPIFPIPVGDTEVPHVSQNLFGALLKGYIDTGDDSRAGLDIDADFLRTSPSNTAAIPYDSNSFGERGVRTIGLMTFTPYWALHGDICALRLGVKLDLAFNSGRALRLQPDVTFAWTPSQIFGLELKATGGSRIDQLADVYSITPYINGSVPYGMARVPWAFDGRMTFGPFLGGTLELFGGYAKADEWLMASYAHYVGEPPVMDPVDIKGWHAGVAAGYDNGRTFAIRASYETAPGKYDRAYLEWRDRARHVVKAEVKVRPFKALLLQASYELRAGRSAWGYDLTPDDIMGMEYYTPRRENLRNISDLTISAGYTVTPRLTLFARGQNLLNRRYLHIGMRPSQGTNVMIGAGFKF